MDELELEIKRLIVQVLSLDDLKPDDIGSDEPLFADGLALDSIDGLELGMALRKAYDLKIEAPNEEVRKIFYSVRSIAAFIAKRREAE